MGWWRNCVGLLVFKQQVFTYILHRDLCAVERRSQPDPQISSWGLVFSTRPLTVKCLCEHQLWTKVQNKLFTSSLEFSSIHVGKITSVSNFPMFFVQFCVSELFIRSNLLGPSFYLMLNLLFRFPSTCFHTPSHSCCFPHPSVSVHLLFPSCLTFPLCSSSVG